MERWNFHRWCRASIAVSGPMPPRSHLNHMIGEAAKALTIAGYRPIALTVESWRRPAGIVDTGGNDFLARLRIDCEPGLLLGSFRSWYQWQHPRWSWSVEAFPSYLSIEARAQ